MAVCLQSAGLIDTGSLCVQDGLQLSQFGISSNSPNLPISSEREQAPRASTFWMFFLSFRLSSRITPPISLCLPFPILYLSLSLYRCFSVPLAFSLTLHALLLVSFSFLFHLYYFLPFFPLLELFSRPSSPSFPRSLSLSLASSLAVFFVCVFLFQEAGCRHCPVLTLHNKALMSLHTDVNRNIRPWSHQSAVAMVTKCHRSHPRKKKEREMERWLDEEGKKCAVCVRMTEIKNIFVQGDVWWEYMIYNISVLNVAWTVDRDRKEAKSSQWYWYIDLCAHLCVFII